MLAYMCNIKCLLLTSSLCQTSNMLFQSRKYFREMFWKNYAHACTVNTPYRPDTYRGSMWVSFYQQFWYF